MAAGKSGKCSEIEKEIKIASKSCIEDKKNSNCIIDIIGHSQSDDVRILQACARAFHKVFNHFISSGEMFLEKPAEKLNQETDLSKEDRYRIWLVERYKDAVDRLLQLLHHSNPTVQEVSLCTLMKFVESEGHTPITKNMNKQISFPSILFQRIIAQLLSPEVELESLLTRFQEYMEYDDVRYHVLKYLVADLKAKSQQELTEVYKTNIFVLLERISFPIVQDELLSQFLTKAPDEGVQLKINSLKQQRKMFTTCWVDFLKMKLSTSLYRKILVILHDKVMPHLTSPLLLSDFLTDSYNIGGAISLLALNGVFILIQKYNLDYPDFYKKLYALFEPSVFHVKYRARFFFLADLFLSSTHLPAYLVAAFAKKLARISLTAPTPGLTISIPFIYNLINRHPNCKVLLHRTDGPSDITDDPYDANELDPGKCKAMNSSLWELKTLQSHYNPDIARSAQKIEHPLDPSEINLSKLLENTYSDIFEGEVKKKMKSVPVNFEPPNGFLGLKHDKFKLCWTFS